jgi:hypothetical protein
MLYDKQTTLKASDDIIHHNHGKSFTSRHIIRLQTIKTLLQQIRQIIRVRDKLGPTTNVE